MYTILNKNRVLHAFVLTSLVTAVSPVSDVMSETEIRGSGDFKFSVEWSDGEIVQQELGIGLKRIPFGSSLDDLLQDGFSCSPMAHDPKLHQCEKSSPKMTFLGQPAKGIAFARDAFPIDYAVIETRIPHSQIREALNAKYEATPFVQTQGWGKDYSEKYSSFYWVFADRGVIELEVTGSSPFAERIRLYSSTSSEQKRYLFAREALKELSPELDPEDL